MSWKKYFTVVNPTNPQPGAASADRGATGTTSNYSSYLPEVYAGHPNRIQRYYQYDDMDRDSDINAALDTIADFCTQSEEQADDPFDIFFNEEATETEVLLLKKYLVKWTKINGFGSRLFYMFRNTVKNGDAFFLRDPETAEWLWLDHFQVEGVKVDEEHGKEPTEYLIRGFDLSLQGKFAAKQADLSNYRMPYGSGAANGTRPMSGGSSGSGFQMAGGVRDPRQMRQGQAGGNELMAIDAKHVIHLSLSVGMDINWPFGQSILDPVFKTYKQKELLEDSIIIYRVQRAPERRVFYIDTGLMSPPKARAHLDQIKNEIHQRRIPNHTGGGGSILDAAYNPLSINEDFFFAQSAEGRGSKVDTLPGGENLGEITDLSFFSKKMARGLRIPSSYLSLGDDEGQGAAYNDGKLGAALIQEFRFNKYCMRLQALLSPKYDFEFKQFLDRNGVEIESSLFELRFQTPQNFTKYRQIEIDQAQVGIYQMVADNKKIAERFRQERYLNWSEDEVLRNEKLWAEENAGKIKKATGASPAENNMDTDLSSVGVRPPGDDFMDMDGMDPDAPMDDAGMEGDGGAAPPPAPGAEPPIPGGV